MTTLLIVVIATLVVVIGLLCYEVRKYLKYNARIDAERRKL